MDEVHFDALTRRLTRRISRRSTLGAAIVAALGPLRGGTPTAAKKKRRKKCKPPCGPCTTCNKRKGKCTPQPDGTSCGPAKVCAGGSCTCQSTHDACGTTCCPRGEGKGCVNGTCGCSSTHFACGANCCLKGAPCLPLFGNICGTGSKQPGEHCNPATPGECASGRCTTLTGGTSICRSAQCLAPQQLCNGDPFCCNGICWNVTTACGSNSRCCLFPGEQCQEDCDCCNLSGSGQPVRVCQQGRCCVAEFSLCAFSAQCCDGLVCHDQLCLKP